MASIRNARLELLEHNHKNRTATVRVSYTALFNAVERNMKGLRYREVIDLWGADDPDPDDHLYRFADALFSVETDGTVVRSRTVTLADDILDEDGWLRPTDEVYARICITPLLPTGSCARTNEIHHRF
ncbi:MULTISPECIES: hypothetical protein [Streptomyces]|uniref:Uncharacterized protein n=1 Tax=Streptomyces chengmaiensis TaxID=3040919 RepID=A0ABT6HI33_9ACTN|nr:MULTISPECIES: hypothetical protein [Streptomyces]MDH2388421.1 hypothetical protein [Streptomyces chengmaiensis]WRQ80690.1 hypothetical protein I3F59_015700 [Streptomyces sp. MUM 178J]